MTVDCVICGQPLAGDPEDDPDGASPERPICGECTRARNFDDLLWQGRRCPDPVALRRHHDPQAGQARLRRRHDDEDVEAAGRDYRQ
jgi:hypothetical protein